ncbi:PAS domain S-box protein [Maribacter chungangensis]|uniref:histidine kinase n=1 Tax=Maribacter chungangensis TaxID=1069117 RepID=A0ABW3B3Y1_9FLAO
MKQKSTDNALLQAIFDSSIEGIMVVDVQGTVLEANESCHTIFGYESGQLGGLNIQVLLPERFKKRHATHRENYAKNPERRTMGTGLDLCGVKRNGEEFPVDISLSPANVAGNPVTIAYVRDATKRINDVALLEKSNQVMAEINRKYSALIGNLQGIVFRCQFNRDYTMDYISDGARPILGYGPNAFLENKVNYGQLIVPEDRDRVWKEITDAVKQNIPFSIHYRIKDKQGVLKYVRETGNIIYDKSGKVAALEGFIADISQEKEAENELRSKEAKNKALLDALPDMMFIQDLEGNYLDLYAPEPEKLFFPKSEMIGQNMKDVLPPNLYSRYKDLFKKVRKTRKLQLFEYTHKGKNGETVYEVRTVPLNAHALLTIVRDLTSKRKTEQDLRDSEAKNKAVLQAMPDLYFLMDTKGVYLDVRAPYPSLLVAPADELLGRNMADFLPEPFVESIFEAFHKSKNTNRPEILEHQMELNKSIKFFESRVVAAGEIGFLFITRDITERKRSEADLFIKDRALESAGNGILIVDAKQHDQPIIYANRAFYEMTGYTSEEVMGKNCRFLQNNDRDQKAIGVMSTAIKNGEACQVTVRNYKKDGTLFWNELTITPVHDDKNELSHFIGMQNDVTDRKKEEVFKNHIRKILEMIAQHKPLITIGQEILRTSESSIGEGTTFIQTLDPIKKTLHQLVASNLPNTFVTSLEGVSVGPNMGACGSAAYLKKPVIAANLTKGHSLKKLNRLAIDNGIVACWSYPIFASDNSVLGIFALYHSIEKTPSKIQKEIIANLVQLTAIALEQYKVRDELKKNRWMLEGYARELEQKVTERTDELKLTVKQLVQTNIQLKEQVQETKAAENRALESQVMFTAISKNFPKGVIIVFNSDFEIVYIDGGELTRMGFQKNQFEGFHIDDIEAFSKQRILRIKEDIEKTMNGEQLSFEIQFRGKTYAVNTSPLQAGNEIAKWTLFVYNDITKQKEAEKNIRRALVQEQELNELKSRFISMASHEFRTPLSAILSSAILIRRQHQPDKLEKREKYVKQIESNVRNLVVILNDFLSLSKLEEGKTAFRPELFNLVELVQQVLEEIETSKKDGQDIVFKHDDPDVRVRLDTKLMRHVLINLLSNAIKYADENTTIDVAITVLRQKVSIEVSDEGIGIPLAEQENLFNRFFRAKNADNIQGTGLGLHIVKHYTELMGGTVGFESEEGKGSTFWVEFKNLEAQKPV